MSNTPEEDSRLLREIYAVLIGDPINGKPGLSAKVEEHQRILFGGPESEGLLKQAQDNRRYINMGAGMVVLMTVIIGIIGMYLTYRLK